jgi:hypothetical protein
LKRLINIINLSSSRGLSENGYFSSCFWRDVRLEARDLGLGLEKTISFSDSLLVKKDALF